MGVGYVLEQKGGDGKLNVNGSLASYTVATNETVEAGNFVTLTASNTIKKVVSQAEKILGIAKSKGSGGKSIKVYVYGGV